MTFFIYKSSLANSTILYAHEGHWLALALVTNFLTACLIVGCFVLVDKC